MDKDQNRISAKRVLLTSFVVDFIDVVLGVAVTIFSGSVVILSQALEGAADLVASGLLLFGRRRSIRKADPTHPFGYGRELYFWTLMSALIMLSVTSTLTFYFGLQRFLNPKELENTALAFGVLVLTAVTNGYALSLSIRRLVGNRKVSRIWNIFYESSLIETKTAFVLDLMGTTASIVGFGALLVYAFTGDGRYDGLGAMGIGLVLAVFSLSLLFAIKDFLIGRGVSVGTIESIKTAAKRVEHVRSVEDLKATHIGPDKIMVNIEINAKNGLTTDELEKLTDKVRTEIKKDLPQAEHIQIELESAD